MAGEIQKGDTFVDGQTVTASRLNSLVDSATALKGIILNQPLKAAPAVSDGLLIYDTATGDLARTGTATLPGVTSVGLTMPVSEFTVTGSPVTATGTLTTTWKTQTLQKFFASPVAGTGVPTFRAMTAPDLVLPPVSIAATTIDWSQGSLFVKVLTVSVTFTMIAISDGQSITVLVSQSGASNFAVTWSGAIRWPAGVAPVMSTGSGKADIYQFWSVSGVIFGTRLAANLS